MAQSHEKDPFVQQMNQLYSVSLENIEQVTADLKEQLPETKSKLEQVIQKLPAEVKEYANRISQDLINQILYLERLGEGYSKVKVVKERFAGYASYIDQPGRLKLFLHNNPGYENKIKSKEDFMKVYKNLDVAENNYVKIWNNTWKKLFDLGKEVHKIEQKYLYRKDSNNLEKTFAIAILAVFGGSVLYFLSQARPENLTTGAFVVDTVSPSLLAILTSVIIFVLFFLTHHKLK